MQSRRERLANKLPPIPKKLDPEKVHEGIRQLRASLPKDAEQEREKNLLPWDWRNRIIRI